MTVLTVRGDCRGQFPVNGALTLVCPDSLLWVAIPRCQRFHPIHGSTNLGPVDQRPCKNQDAADR